MVALTVFALFVIAGIVGIVKYRKSLSDDGFVDDAQILSEALIAAAKARDAALRSQSGTAQQA